MKRTVPLLITAGIGLALILAFYFPITPFTQLDEYIPDYFNIIAAFAFVLGGGNLLRVHLTKITQRQHEWGYSLVTVLGFVFMLLVGLLKIGNTGDGFGMNPKAGLADPGLTYDWLYQGVFYPCQATMFSLLAFFVASASYRAFRAKTPEATVLLIAAFIILIGRTPVGAWLTIWMPEPYSEYFTIPSMSAWILSTPNLAGQRTIQIGIALGIISYSLRLILGIERTHIGGD